MGNTIPFSTGAVVIDQKIGAGGFSQVFLGHVQNAPARRVAVKAMGYGDEATFKRVLLEANLHKRFSACPHVVQFIEFVSH